MWWYVLCAVLALGVGVGCGIGFEKLGQFMYYRRMSGSGNVNELQDKFAKEARAIVESGKETDVVFLGDSITQGYNIEKFYPNKNYVNSGIGGNIAYQVLERLDDNVIILKPKKVILLIGTNDLGLGFSAQTSAKAIDEILSKLHGKLPETQVIVESVYPINDKMLHDFNRTNENIDKLNVLLKESCAKQKADYLDIFAAIADGDKQLRADLTKDGLHLNNKGYTIVTNFLRSHVQGL